MDKQMIDALLTFNRAMDDLIEACADLAAIDGREEVETLCGANIHVAGGVPEEGRGGSWERAVGYEQVLTRFAAARAAYCAIPDRE